MYKPPDFEYIKFGKVTLDGGTRTYQTPDGNLPSVTTILGATGDKTFLDAWRKRIGNTQADKESKQATGLGSLMHLHLENYILGVPRPSGNNLVRKMAEHMADEIINRGLVNVQEIWAIEQPLWFPGLYAGTADLVMIHNQTLCIGDYKTTKKPKKDEWVTDYKLQLVAYALAHNEVYDTNIKKGVIFMASRETQYQEWIVDGLEFDKHTEIWYDRLDTFYGSR